MKGDGEYRRSSVTTLQQQDFLIHDLKTFTTLHMTVNTLEVIIRWQSKWIISNLAWPAYGYKSQPASILADSQAAAAAPPSASWEMDLRSPGRSRVPRLTPASVWCVRKTYLRSGKKPGVLWIPRAIELHTLGARPARRRRSNRVMCDNAIRLAWGHWCSASESNDRCATAFFRVT